MTAERAQNEPSDLSVALHRLGNALTAVECLWFVIHTDLDASRHDEAAWNKMDALVADAKVALEQVHQVTNR